MKKWLLIQCLLAWSLCMGAQTRISGQTVDAKGEALPGIVVKALAADGQRMLDYAISDGEGRYNISLPAGQEPVKIVLSGMGYRTVERTGGKGNIDMGRITMEEAELELKEVTVKAPPVHTKGDTITYIVDQLKDKSDRNIEDVIKKIPGVEVDQEGRIKYQGEAINKFYIEGLDMLGGRYTLASQNIQPDDIASISVYENHQPKRVLQGIEFSKQAALNLTMKRNRMMRPIVTATVGAGYGDEALWLAEGTGLFISPRKQYLLTAKTNNAGNFYDKEVTNFSATSIFPTTLAQNMLTAASSDNAHISRDRYVSNRSATGSLNTIRKLREDHTLSLNAGYHFNRLGSDQSQLSDYWQQDAPSILTREDISGKSRRHGGWLTLRYERNEKGTYLSETLNAEGSLTSLTDHIDGGTPVRQHVRTDYYALDNRVSAIWRRGNRLFTLNSDVALAQVPRSTLEAVMTDRDSTFVGQDVSSLKFRTAHSTSYGWVLGGRSVISLNARLQADYDRLSADNDTDEGLYSGYVIRTSVYPSYKYSTNQLSWEMSVPLHMIDLRYSDRLTDTRLSYHRPLVSARTSFSYRFGAKTRFSLRGEASRSLGNLRDMVLVPIHTTYRQTQIYGTGLLNQNTRLSLNGSASYRNPLRGTNYSLNVEYQHGRSNRMTGSNVTASSTETVWADMRNTSNMWVAGLNIAKNLLGTGTILTFSANLANLSTQSLRQGEAYRMANNTLTLKANSHSTLLNRHLIVDVDCQYVLSAQHIATMPDNNLRNDIIPSLRLTVCPTDQWEVYARAFMGYVQNNGNKFDSNFYLDAGVRYIHQRFEVELIGKNLTDQHDYTQRRFATLDRFTYLYHLRPIEVLLTFRFKF